MHKWTEYPIIAVDSPATVPGLLHQLLSCNNSGAETTPATVQQQFRDYPGTASTTLQQQFLDYPGTASTTVQQQFRDYPGTVSAIATVFPSIPYTVVTLTVPGLSRDSTSNCHPCVKSIPIRCNHFDSPGIIQHYGLQQP